MTSAELADKIAALGVMAGTTLEVVTAGPHVRVDLCGDSVRALRGHGDVWTIEHGKWTDSEVKIADRMARAALDVNIGDLSVKTIGHFREYSLIPDDVSVT